MTGISIASKNESWTLGRRNNALFYLIFSSVFVFIGSAEVKPITNSEHCIWYGECVSPWFGSHKNCLNNTVAQPLSDAGRTLLLKHCPDYNKYSRGSMNTCCDTNQLKTMDSSISRLAMTMRHCPACLKNIKKHICDLTCSPRQSHFISVTDVKQNEKGNKYIDGIEIYITNKYIEGTLDSCRGVKIGWFFSFVDRMWNMGRTRDRTALSFFNSMGQQAPFRMTYVNSNGPINKYYPLDPIVTPCKP